MEKAEGPDDWPAWAARAYGDLANPDFSFVGECYERNPYAEPIRRISAIAPVQDRTNLDDYVCFDLEVDGGRRRTWLVQLSMVGPFAMVIRVDRSGVFLRNAVSTAVVETDDPTGARILGILRESGFHLLSAEESKTSVPFRIPPDEEPEDGPLYRVLFGDATELPW
ncbi:hypothetical protein ACFRAR_36035 [Kitasatospora sp. NPDC056651]|uniref:hypothetical protein n=1 Tax=Kitasatospora sp. NPDC056651 TaxID=3345892 RepID=UPI00369DD91F